MFKDLSWAGSSGVIQQSLLDDVAMRSQVTVSFSPIPASSELGRGTRGGKYTFPGTAITSTSLDYLSGSVTTQRGELHVNNWKCPMFHLSFLGDDPHTPTLNKVEMTAMFGWKFLLILSSKSGTIHLQEWFLTILEYNVIICLFRKSYWF